MRSVALATCIAAAAWLAACATPEAPKPAPPPPKCEDAPAQMMMRELEPGAGDPVTARTAVLVSYTGWLYDPCKPDHKGEMFDTSEGRQTPFGFIVGAGRVIKGWDEGVVGMRENGKRQLIIPADKAYGAAGAGGGKIPPNAALVFDVQVVKVVMRPPPRAGGEVKLTSSSFDDGGVIPAQYAFCAPDEKAHATLSKNLNPQLSWREVPMGTRSFVLVCHDPDVPSRGDDVNQEGRSVPKSLARVDFFHWVLVDLPATEVGVTVGEYSSAVVPRGKPGPKAPHGARQGLNGYTDWFASDKDMAGDYYGYDGPCPPWNDELPHRYVFTVFALDVERLSLPDRFGGKEAREAVRGHVLAQASITGRYTLNPAVKL